MSKQSPDSDTGEHGDSDVKSGWGLHLPVLGRIPLHPLEFLRVVMMRQGPVWAQFIRYAVCGALATVVMLSIYILFEWLAPEYMSEELPTQERQVHLRWVMVCAFIPSNLLAYFTNRFFVFTPGRHSFWREMGIFTLISAISFSGGELGKYLMISWGYPNYVAALMFAVSSALVNFAARKLIVFKD